MVIIMKFATVKVNVFSEESLRVRFFVIAESSGTRLVMFFPPNLADL